MISSVAVRLAWFQMTKGSKMQASNRNVLSQVYRRFGFLMLALACSVLAAGSVVADEKVYAKTVKSTVWIVAKKSTGSGILVDKTNRLVVTNEHVVGSEETVTIFFPADVNGRQSASRKHYLDRTKTLGIKGKIIARNVQRDVAIVQLERLPTGVEAIKIGKPAQPGAEVHSIGNPSDSDALWVYTSGQVRANYYRIFSTSKRHRMQVLETQSPINPGDSGGPIVNNQSELVGISQSFSTKGRLISHGVDISEITWFLDKVRTENKSLKAGKTTGKTNKNKTSKPTNSGESKSGFGSHSVDVGGGRSQTVFVAREIDQFQKIQTRRVYALAHSYSGKVPATAQAAMLEQNGVTKIGGWVLEKGSDGKTHVIFLAHASVHADDGEIDSVIEYVGKVAEAMRKRLGK